MAEQQLTEQQLAEYPRCLECNLLLTTNHKCVFDECYRCKIVFSPFDKSYEEHICKIPNKYKASMTSDEYNYVCLALTHIDKINVKCIKEVCNK